MNININNPKEVFYAFLYDSKISYVGAGTSGLGLELFNTTNNSYKILTTNNENVVCSKLFLKLVPIYNEEIDITMEFEVPNSSSALIISSLETNFWSEVSKQTIVYKETCDNLEPICPPIVYTECKTNIDSIKFINELKNNYVGNLNEDDDDDDPLIVITKKYNKYSKLKLGIIAMGFTTDYIPLYKAIRAEPSKRKFYMELAIYELVRLYAFGYLHGDFSLANIMINPTYNYTGTNTGRAMLIDFGMTYEHNYTDTSILSILNHMLHTRVPSNNIIPINHNNYKWLNTYIEQNKENIENTWNELSKQINNHNQLMINMIENTYPDILSQIRNYILNSTNENIFRGGFVSNIENASNEMNYQTRIKDNIYIKPMNIISITQFNNIFNPNNLDIFKVKDDYLHTLMLGYISIKYGKNKINLSTGGKKRKSKSKKRKSKKRTRTYKNKYYDRKTQK